MMTGTASGMTSLRRICHFDAPSERNSCSRSSFTFTTPESVLMKGAKKHTSMMIAIFDCAPKPTAAMMSGATAMRGVASITITYGCRKRRTSAFSPTIAPSPTPRIEPMAKPANTRPSETPRLGQMFI